jgi:hypothetical protein
VHASSPTGAHICRCSSRAFSSEVVEVEVVSKDFLISRLLLGGSSTSDLAL